MRGVFGSFIPAFYVKIARQSAGASIKFLLIFILILSFFFCLRDTLVLNLVFKSAQKWAQFNLENISRVFPEIEVKNGELIQPKETYVLEDTGSSFVLAVEPDPQKEAAILAKFRNVIMLTGKRVVFKKTAADSASEERSNELPKLKNWKLSPAGSGFVLSSDNNQVSITPLTIKNWLRILAIFIFPVFLFFWFCFYSLIKFFQVFFFSLIGLIANAGLKAHAAYKQIFNICAYAVVPPTIILLFGEVFSLRLPGLWFLFNAIYVLYVFLGLQAVKSVEPPPEAPADQK